MKYELTPFGREVKVYLGLTDVSQAALAAAVGITPGYLGQIMRRKRISEAVEEKVRAYMDTNPAPQIAKKARESA